MKDDILYNNDNYLVRTRDVSLELDGVTYPRHYTVENMKTEVVEFRTPVLPEAYNVAVKLDIALVHEHHLWPYKAMEERGKEDTGDLAKVLQ